MKKKAGLKTIAGYLKLILLLKLLIHFCDLCLMEDAKP